MRSECNSLKAVTKTCGIDTGTDDIHRDETDMGAWVREQRDHITITKYYKQKRTRI